MFFILEKKNFFFFFKKTLATYDGLGNKFFVRRRIVTRVI